MRTTIDFPDDLFRELKVTAALDGLKLKDLIIRYVQQGLRQRVAAAPLRRQRSELPVVRKATGHSLPALANADIERILEEDETAGARRDRC